MAWQRSSAGGGRRIRSWLVLLVAGCVLPLWLLSGLLVFYSYSYKQALSRQHLQETARALSLAVDRELAMVKVALRVLATSPYLADGDLERFHAQADEVARSFEGIAIILAEESGLQLVNTLQEWGAPPRKRTPVAELREVFATGQPVIADLWIGPVSKKAQIGVETPVMRDGRVAFDLGMSVPAGRFVEILRRQQLPDSFLGAILDRSGTVVARVPDHERFVGQKGRANLLEAIRAAPEGTTELVSFEGKPMTAAFSRWAESGWTVVIGQPTGEAMAEARSWLLWMLGAAAVVSAVGMALALRLGRPIEHSIRALVGPALALGHGRFEAIGPLDLKEADEVAQALSDAAALLGRRGAERDEAEQALARHVVLLERHHESLRGLADIAALPLHDETLPVRAALALGVRHLGLTAGVVARVVDGRYTVVHAVTPPDMTVEGTVAGAPGSTWSAAVLETGDVVTADGGGGGVVTADGGGVVTADGGGGGVVTADGGGGGRWHGHPGFPAAWTAVFIGAPVPVDGRVWGTVEFMSDGTMARAFDDGDREFMRLLARWMGAAIERADIQRDLRETAFRLQAILSSAPAGIATVDPGRRITSANARMAQMFQRREDELVGASTRLLCNSDEAWNALANRLTPRLDGGDTVCEDVPMRRADETIFWARIIGQRVSMDDAALGICWIVEDITERRQTEEALARQAAELERSNAELEAFAYVASHDLRQPLRSISSYLVLLERDLDGMLNDETREFLGFARDGARRMDRLIVDLLDYSRVGRRSKPFADHGADDIIGAAVQNVEFAIGEALATVTVTLGDNTAPLRGEGLPPVYGDASELVRLFQNLIGNAVKYRAPDRPPVVHVDVQEEAGGWHVTVADNGIGIPPQHFQRIFGIFQRLHPPAEYEGTGIGLSVCKKIVEHHHGRIWVTSEPGRGSTFHVVLPPHLPAG
jgi:PAS domain S-box-containing protein